VTTPTGSQANVPLTGATWTQGAAELNQVVVQLTMTKPPFAMCENELSIFGLGTVTILQDGVQVASVSALATGNHEETQTLTGEQSGFLFEPGKATARSLTAQASDSCEMGGGHFTIHSVEVDVIGVH
jgi:hypothetical protein